MTPRWALAVFQIRRAYAVCYRSNLCFPSPKISGISKPIPRRMIRLPGTCTNRSCDQDAPLLSLLRPLEFSVETCCESEVPYIARRPAKAAWHSYYTSTMQSCLQFVFRFNFQRNFGKKQVQPYGLRIFLGSTVSRLLLHTAKLHELCSCYGRRLSLSPSET